MGGMLDKGVPRLQVGDFQALVQRENPRSAPLLTPLTEWRGYCSCLGLDSKESPPSLTSAQWLGWRSRGFRELANDADNPVLSRWRLFTLPGSGLSTPDTP